MSITHVIESPGYLLIKAAGKWTEKVAEGIIDEVRREAEHRGFHRLLLDLCELSPPESEMVRFWSGKHLAETLPVPFKVAVFAKPESINRFGETVAVNRGANLSVFIDERSAIQWLMKEVGAA